MTADHRARATHRARPRMAGALVAFLVASAACASEADPADVTLDIGEFAATADYLSSVAEAASGQSYRIAVDMTMRADPGGDDGFEVGGEMMTGEVDGEMSSLVLDMGPIMNEMAPGAPIDGDLTMTMVTDGNVLYLQAPFFRTVAEAAQSEGATRAELGPLAAIAELGEDEWGRVDLEGLTMAEVAQTTGAQGVSADVFLDMVAGGEDVEELGAEEIRGVDTRGLGATASYEDMILAQGIDLDEFRELFTDTAPGGVSGDEVDTVIDAMLELEIPLEVWVDDDDNVRRVTMALDMGGLMESIQEIDPSAEEFSMSLSMSMDMFDYGDQSIEIEIPTESVDITDEFLELQESGGTGGGTGALALGST